MLNKSDVQNIMGLNPSQEGILFYYLSDTSGNQYNIQFVVTVEGVVEEELFEKACNGVIDNNEMLRTIFKWEKIKRPVQITLKKKDIKLDVHKFHTLDEFNQFVKEDYNKPFNLKESCFRISLCKREDGNSAIVLTFHHIICDGWSNGVLWKEIFEQYNSLCKQNECIKKQKQSYKLYVDNCNQTDKDLFWSKYLGQLDEISAIKEKTITDKKETKIASYYKEAGKALEEKIDRYVKSNNTSLANFMYAVWGILLQYYCNRKDVLFGRVVSGRNVNLPGIEDMIGMFINVIPMKLTIDGKQPACRFMDSVKEDVLEAQPYEQMALYQIKKQIGFNQKGDLFNSIVVVENYPLDIEGLKNNYGLNIMDYSFRETNHYDLTLSVELIQGLQLHFMYDEAWYHREFIERLSDNLIQIMNSLIENQNGLLEEIKIIDQKEEEVYKQFNDTDAHFDAGKNIIQLFQEQVLENPEKIALVTENENISYGTFHEKSNQVANYLIMNGVKKNDIVGVMLDRSANMVITLFGIIKAGAAYLPIDPNNPDDRIHYIIEDAGFNILISSDTYKNRITNNIQFKDIQEILDGDCKITNPDVGIDPENACYVIYTSGTTGKPKGVVIEHRALVNRLQWMQKNTPIGNGDIVLQKTNYTFDVSVWELIWWSLEGASLMLLKPNGEKNPAEILQAVAKGNVTTMHFVPSMLNAFLMYLETVKDKKQLSSLKYVITSGEALTREHVEKFNRLVNKDNNVRLVNLYGPTEATIDVSYFNCPADEKELEFVPIGKPIDNIKLHVIAPNGQLQPIGVAGELCISGVGLAREYLNRPELTSEKFVMNRILNGERYYRTGDLARWTKDGVLEYLGRIDNQIKIRGFRIEIDEIETVMSHLDGIDDVAVIPKKDKQNEHYLTAYLVTKKDMDVNAVKSALKKKLPTYMVPAFIEQMRSFPIKPNGKLDRAQLAAINSSCEEKKNSVTTKYQNEIQNEISKVWKEILPDSKFGINDNFFDVGGNSISLIRVFSKLSPQFGEKLSMDDLFAYPSIASLAAYLSNEEKEEEQPEEIRTEEDSDSTDVAVIGFAGTFPESDNINEYWKNLSEGKECIHFYSEEELKEGHVPEHIYKDENYVNALGRIERGKSFDPAFFKYTQKEAQLLDPQIRLMMMNVWESLEDSGYSNETDREKVGLFLGASPNYFWEEAVINSGNAKVIGDFSAEKLFNKDHMAAQIAYKLNLTGPVMCLHTACSTSLVAVHLAANAIKNGECSLAVAGGVSNVSYYGDYGYTYQDGMVFSPDGHCRPFDESGAGFVGGTGTGSVVLKRLDLAKRDGDRILCVIKGTGVTNDGSNKVGYASPSVTGQVAAIKEAFAKANIEPESVQYVETHGTGTSLGDLIEVKALEQVYGLKKKNYCALGSVKANIGHLDCAAGIAGLLKTVLVLKNRVIPPLINMKAPNPKLDIMNGPFYINDEAVVLENTDRPVRAAVNGIGLGGTNAHIILEEYIDKTKKAEKTVINESDQILCLSARTESALKNMGNILAKHLKETEDISLTDVAYTLKTARKPFEYRKVIRAKTLKDTLSQLRKVKRESYTECKQAEGIVFESHNRQWYLELNDDSYKKNPLLVQGMQACMELVKAQTGDDLEQQVLKNQYSSAKVEEQGYEDILNFSIIYANVNSFIKLGITPDYLYGTGIAELVNMVIAKVLTLEDAMKVLVSKRNGTLHSLNIELEAPVVKYFIGEKNRWCEKEELVSFQQIDWDLEDTKVRKQDAYHLLTDTKSSCFVEFDCIDMTDKLHSLWEQGLDVNWKNWYQERKYERIALPSYPFDRKEYWIEEEERKQYQQVQEDRLVKNEDIAKWFYVPYWEPELLMNQEKLRSVKVLYVTPSQNQNASLCREKLKSHGEVTALYLDGKYEKVNSKEYKVNGLCEADYVSVLKEMAQEQAEELHVVYEAGDWEENTSKQEYKSFFQLLYLCRAINKVSFKENITLHMITQNGIAVNEIEELRPETAMLHALGLVVSQELSSLKVHAIDIMEETGWRKERLYEMLSQEIITDTDQFICAYRKNKRYIRKFKQQILPELKDRKIKKDGVYLILGGLGGVGTELAKHFAKSGAKLILSSRTQIPARETWKDYQDDADPISKKIRQIEEIERLGAEVETIASDVTKEEEMRNLINQIDSKYKTLDGVVFATVANNQSMFKTTNDLEANDCYEQFKPKVTGIEVLENVLGERKLDFCMIMSSTSSVLGGLGFAAYSAANAYMDCFVRKHNQEHENQWITVDWESWSVSTNQRVFDFKAGIQELTMCPEEGCEAFERIIQNQDAEHILVSSGDLEIRLKEWVNKKEQGEKKTANGTSYEEMGLSSEYKPPKSEMEDIIARAWADFFGIEKVGIDDNLFELGATSLSVIQLNANLRSELNRSIPIVKLFAYPTVRELAGYLANEESESETGNSKERTEIVNSGRKSSRKRLELRRKRE